MKNKAFLLLQYILCVLFFCKTHSIFASEFPQEVVILELPASQHSKWKEISHHVCVKEGLIELIPVTQKIENWEELIGIQYYNIPNVKTGIVETFLDMTHETVVNSYPGNQTTFRVLQKNERDVIYEWRLHEPYKDIPAQHEVARAIFTKDGLHRVGFTRKHREMDGEEKEQWIQLLQKGVKVVPTKKAERMPSILSFIERNYHSLDLGQVFEKWKIKDVYSLSNGCTLEQVLPPDFNESYVNECLEVVTMPNVEELSIEMFFEREQAARKNQFSNQIDLEILQQLPNELIYRFSHPKDALLLTGIVRCIVTPQGCFLICYKHGLDGDMPREDIEQWKNNLKSIKTKSHF